MAERRGLQMNEKSYQLPLRQTSEDSSSYKAAPTSATNRSRIERLKEPELHYFPRKDLNSSLGNKQEAANAIEPSNKHSTNY
jgi:hypothetical protein